MVRQQWELAGFDCKVLALLQAAEQGLGMESWMAG